jgi:hypothetical protein
MKMAKRVLIAIAVVAFLATTVQAYDPAIKSDSTNMPGNKKDNWWPFEYVALDLCWMPVYMEVGMYVQMKECDKKKIELKQVDCVDIGKEAKHFPCYNDCESFDIRANFQVKLGTRLEKSGPAIKDWEGYYDGDDLVPGDGAWYTRTVCVKAWSSEIWNVAPGDKVTVGNLSVTVKPNM